VLEDSPSLRSTVAQMLHQAYDIARESAEEETGLAEAVFPHFCPFTPDEVLSRGFLPER